MRVRFGETGIEVEVWGPLGFVLVLSDGVGGAVQ